VAPHLALARPDGDPAVVAVLRAAARMATGRGEPADAVALLERALAEPPASDERAEVLVDLARAMALAGRADALARMREGLELIDDPERAAALLAELARLLHHAGDFRAAAEVARQAAAGLPPDHPLQDRLLAAYLDAAVLHPDLRHDAEVELGRLMAGARAGRPPSDPRLLAQVAVAMARLGDPPALVRALAVAAFDSDPLVDDATQGISMAYAFAALEWVDELEALDPLLDAAIQAARRRGAMTALSFASYWRALAGLHQGRLADASADAERALTIYHQGWTGSPFCATAVARVRLAVGDLDAAAAAIALGEEASSGRPEDALLLEAKEVALARGEGPTALAAARAAGEVSEGTYGSSSPRIFAWRRLAALGAAQAGAQEEAIRLADEHLALSRLLGAPRQLGQALHAAGVVRGGDAGVALLEEAVTVLERSPARLPLARALVAHGSALRRRGGRTTALPLLERGLDLAVAFGAAPLAEEARAQLAAMGLRRRPAHTLPGGLTPGQRRVARMAADGHSNPQIARRLNLNLKTVETHLTTAYRTLGIAGRAELAERLEQEAPRP
jgi:DNA-binding CsgD family transcriptional regulator